MVDMGEGFQGQAKCREFLFQATLEYCIKSWKSINLLFSVCQFWYIEFCHLLSLFEQMFSMIGHLKLCFVLFSLTTMMNSKLSRILRYERGKYTFQIWTYVILFICGFVKATLSVSHYLAYCIEHFNISCTSVNDAENCLWQIAFSISTQTSFFASSYSFLWDFFFPCRTKRMIVDVLNVQAGENLTEILETPASDEQVKVVYDQYLIC